jgi:hypothetical protein
MSQHPVLERRSIFQSARATRELLSLWPKFERYLQGRSSCRLENLQRTSLNRTQNPHALKGCIALLLFACLGASFQLRAASCAPVPVGLTGWWPAEGTANDIIGTNNGILQGGASANAPGFVGTGFSFDGTNSFAQFPDSPVFHPTNLTVEAWVRFAGLDSAASGGSPPGEQYIIFKQNSQSASFEGFDLGKGRVGGNDFFRFMVSSSAGVEVELFSTTIVSTGVWYHVAGVRGSNFIQLYLNGQLQSQTNVSFPQNYGTFPMYFGSSGQSSWDHKFKGTLDEPSLYNRPLSSNEIAAIYAAGAAGKCGPPRILTQPQNQTVAIGSNATFSVSAGGATPFVYQWQFSGTNLASGTDSSLTVTNAQLTAAGNYSVLVSGPGGAVTSSVAVLTVLTPPSIAAQPASQTTPIGATAAFVSSASGSAPLGYRWQFNGISLTNGGRISGALTTNLVITNAQFADAGNYTMVATNPVGLATSAVAVLTVPSPPTITGQPTNLTAVAGSNANFTVSVAGTPPFVYQWRLGGADLPAGTSSVLSLTNIQPADAGNYAVVVSNSLGVVTSAVAVLTVLVPPSFVSQPASLTNVAGTTAVLFAGASGTTPLGYRWQFNGTNLVNGGRISGATTTNLTVTNVQASDAGNYTLVASNTAAIATSAVATLTVLFPPSIVGQPTNQSIVMGSNALLLVNAAGSAPLSYQWRLGGNDLPGASASFLSLANVQPTNAGSYSVVVTNSVGSVTSALASVTVLVPPLITLQPTNQTDVTGATGSFSSVVLGDLPLVYRWWFNGTALSDGGRVSGAGSNSLTIANAQTNDGGNYYLVVSNSVAVATSVVATLTVVVPPALLTQPNSIALLAGTNVSFSITAAGTPPLNYIWQKGGLNLTDGANITGSTTPTLSLATLQTNDSGGYRVLVSNAGGSVTSSFAILAVTTTPIPPAITIQPASVAAGVGSNVAFAVTAAGTLPLSYQWLKNGTNLADGGPVSGAASNTLALTAVLPSDEGNYQVVVTNGGGAATSAVVSLAVNPAVLIGADAVVLVNSTSAKYTDFQHYIQPYLGNFSVPYTVQDIATNPVGTNIARTALIIIGHRQLDTNHLYLDTNAQANISAAVSNGVGLVNFDSDLFAGSTNRYKFIQDIFGFGFAAVSSNISVTFPPTEPGTNMHFITALHPTNDSISLRTSMRLTGMVLPTNATAIALNGGKPFVIVRKYGLGRAMQWAAEDWMGIAVLGPLEGLDDLVWRGLAWTARKPFVMRSMPNFVTVRIDDCSGPFWWVHTMNDFGMKPFVAAFISDVMTTASAADLRALCTNGNATTSPHAFTGLNLIYFDYHSNTNYTDDVVSNNLYSAKQWHVTNAIPMSKIIATHYSEMGNNAFPGLVDWGTEYFPIEVPPNTLEYSPPYAPWLIAGPYRLYETPLQGQTNYPLYYADWLTVTNHPEFDGKFFNCYTEIRDAASCSQWCPYNNIQPSIDGGTAIVKRGLDSKVLATLFSHEWTIQNTPSVANNQPITTNNWRTIVSGIVSNLAPYQPIYVTLDYGDQYVRATRTSRLVSSALDIASGQLTANWSGKADLDMQVQVYLGDTASNSVVTVPAFTNDNTSLLALLPAPPLLVSQPMGGTYNAGSTAALRAGVGGSTPLSYQWLWNGTNILTDGPRINGSATWALSIANLVRADAGLYSLVVTNAYGSVTSSPVLLRVIDPALLTQPVSRTNHAGSPASFSVQAAGTAPSFQWLKNATVLDDATNPTLSLLSVSPADAGPYAVIVSNIYGSLISATATLSVVDPLQIQSVTASNGSLAISWTAIPGTTYSVQQTTNINQPAWVDLAPPVTAGSFTASITNLTTDSTQSFYRVHLLP